MNYQSGTLDATFYDFKNSLLFLVGIPIFSALLGLYCPIFFAIILMIVLIEYKKIKIFKSYIISIIFFFIGYLILFVQVNSIKYDLEWVICLISLIIASLIVFIVFKKTFTRLDKKYNLR
ncbi:hypothetical protein QWY99_04600 [Flavobacterium branchiarum]|uniref:Uncharacterized protein n=1 Tax=Flavobacterium branchiarum TaxID=1114870 RepID=A0ABV5FKA6_9FLAO|nr:hypothetical protein [Flavobacterium branchiarum]MDN3672337.1 hypothetical protein [Flavobacterium branchiarum]